MEVTVTYASVDTSRKVVVVGYKGGYIVNRYDRGRHYSRNFRFNLSDADIDARLYMETGAQRHESGLNYWPAP